MSISPASRIKYLVRQPSLWIALVLWCLLSAAAIVFCRNGVPLDRPELAATPPITDVLNNSVGLFYGALPGDEFFNSHRGDALIQRS
jgi:hypothetical protein